MTALHKPFYRAAHQIQASIARPDPSQNPILLPAAQWRDLLHVARSVELARHRNWHLAAHRRQRDVLHQLDRVRQSLSTLTDRVDAEQRCKRIPTQGELYRDLLALAAEFPAVRIDTTEHLVCVTTEPIVLEGIELGPFEIRLNWRELESAPVYKVVALEPNPAASSGDTTHPHVNYEQLCEGDGRRAIGAALAAGRLHDFFTIVNQLLHTYAEGRAYVELDAWCGFVCHDCGYLIPADEHYSCSSCEQTVCSDCSRSCRSCDETLCSHCWATCARCDETTCSSCLQNCRQCGRDFCRNCLTENLCSECYETNQETLEESELVPEEETQAADAPL